MGRGGHSGGSRSFLRRVRSGLRKFDRLDNVISVYDRRREWNPSPKESRRRNAWGDTGRGVNALFRNASTNTLRTARNQTTDSRIQGGIDSELARRERYG